MTVEATPAPVAEVATVVRTLRFEVQWPGWRKADLHALWGELWKAQDDLRAAANRTISALYMLRIGTVPWPEAEAQRGANKGTVRKVPLQTLCYQALSGAWQPFGTPLYAPAEGNQRVSSHALLDLAGMIHTRIQTDWVEIQRGQKSLPTWRSMPIGSPYVEVDRELGTVTFSLWAGRGRKVTVRPRKLDTASWRDLRRAVKYGGCRLTWDKPSGRTGKWFLSLSVELPTETRAQAPLVAAVRLGMLTTCTVAYVSRETGKLLGRTDSVDLPASTWRAVRRVEKARTERGAWNRKDHGQRVGRGRDRKLRVVEGLGDIVQRTTDTAIRQVAAAVVSTAIQRGAAVLALPDFAHWSVASEMDKTADLPEGDRAAHRRWYFRFHQGTLRQRIREAAQREGLAVIDVDPKGAGAECSACGKVDAAQRVGRRWVCTCGCQLSVEANTAKVLVKRAAVKSTA